MNDGQVRLSTDCSDCGKRVSAVVPSTSNGESIRCSDCGNINYATDRQGLHEPEEVGA